MSNINTEGHKISDKFLKTMNAIKKNPQEFNTNCKYNTEFVFNHALTRVAIEQVNMIYKKNNKKFEFEENVNDLDNGIKQSLEKHGVDQLEPLRKCLFLGKYTDDQSIQKILTGKYAYELKLKILSDSKEIGIAGLMDNEGNYIVVVLLLGKLMEPGPGPDSENARILKTIYGADDDEIRRFLARNNISDIDKLVDLFYLANKIRENKNK